MTQIVAADSGPSSLVLGVHVGGALWWEPETARGAQLAEPGSRHQPSVLQVTSYSPDLLIHI